MKHTLITLLLLLICKAGMAQEHGAQWVLGTLTSVVDFRNDTVSTYPINKGIPFFLTSACICDEEGNLLYTCYGSAVTDRAGNMLVNGDSLSPCAYTFNNPLGFAIQQAALFIPSPKSNRYYYLLHFSLDTTTNSRPGTLLYSEIDKEGNFSLGSVVQKNTIFYKDVFRSGGMTACKHANGRDWWVTMAKSNANRYYTFLFTSSGISDTLIQDIGPIYNGAFDNSYSCFSNDGTKYVTGTYVGLITIMDFNRCTGEFSNPITIYNNASSDPINHPSSGIGGISFSPNGRYLYATNTSDLNQYDLWSSNPQQDSVMIYKPGPSTSAEIHFLQLAPNSKLYASCRVGGNYFLHVVNRPNEGGDSCSFVYAGQPTLTANSTVLPNMPNYRLGPLVGSGCDTITSTPKSPKGDLNSPLRIQPNPADNYMYIEMPIQGNYIFELINEQGQTVERRETRQVDIINTEALPSGTYFLQVTGSIHATQKVVVQH